MSKLKWKPEVGRWAMLPVRIRNINYHDSEPHIVFGVERGASSYPHASCLRPCPEDTPHMAVLPFKSWVDIQYQDAERRMREATEFNEERYFGGWVDAMDHVFRELRAILAGQGEGS